MHSRASLTTFGRGAIGAVSLGLVVLLSALPAPAETGIYALDNASILVKAPAQTPLVTITRVGRRLLAAGLHGVIIFSDDDGQTWRQSVVPVDLTLTGIYFETPLRGWAAGHYGVVLSTVDGGVTWTKVINGLDVISGLNSTAKLAAAAAATSAATLLDQRVASAFAGAGPNKPFLAIGSCGAGILAVGQQDMAFLSLDDGKRWQEWTSHISDPNFQNIYTILRLGNETLLIGEGGLLLKGDQDCSNFTPVSGPYTATLFGGLQVGVNSLLVFGLDGGLFKSDDGGASWKTLTMPADAVIDAGVALNSGRVLLGTLGGGLYLSDSAINNFQPLAFTEPFQIAAMAVASDGNIVAVGDGGVNIIPALSIK